MKRWIKYIKPYLPAFILGPICMIVEVLGEVWMPKLLSVLKAAKGKSVSREQLIKEVWGEKGNDGLLNLYIHYLRQKLEKDGQRHIFSVRGKGYSYKC